MDFGFLNNLPRISNFNLGQAPNPIAAITESSKQLLSFDIKLLGLSLVSFVPWIVSVKDKFRFPVTVNRKYQQRYKESRKTLEPGEVGYVPRFRPYVAKVPWHGGARGFLSQLFPRYGNYCGPNWSSGKDGGSLLWDRRPIDWLDFCCYCHDMGYDTDDQAKLLKADLAFLECLEKPQMSTKGDAHTAHLYKAMCITGLTNILIPYRRHLVGLQEGRSPFQWLGSLNGLTITPSEWVGSLKRRNVVHKET
ncbi:hypothetical protein AQUCO_00900391v1 [Aquilegia coerulea]|uniref:Phospholipase A2 domain-containing protein n=1 Tax=Aquilegia coerulea TaxID=218851 RepID=A0A2G5EE04_AQUCA|nr:hypothetical protein AQUCO_00900391v1 [Aquilegia coerulea]